MPKRVSPKTRSISSCGSSPRLERRALRSSWWGTPDTRRPRSGEDLSHPQTEKPWYKRWWAIALGIFLIVGFISSFFSDDDEEAEANGAAETEEAQGEGEEVEEAAEAHATEEEPDADEEEEASQDEDEPAEPETEALEIEIHELNPDGESVLQVLFQVDDAFSTNAVVRNLQDGCIEAIQAAKLETSGWYDYDTIQCAGMMGQALNIGTAEFRGAQLAEISDGEMSDDPEAFWNMADRTHIAPQYQ